MKRYLLSICLSCVLSVVGFTSAYAITIVNNTGAKIHARIVDHETKVKDFWHGYIDNEGSQGWTTDHTWIGTDYTPGVLGVFLRTTDSDSEALVDAVQNTSCTLTITKLDNDGNISTSKEGC